MDLLRQIAEFLGTLSYALFAEAACYISVDECPGCMQSGTRIAATEFRANYRWASVMQDSLAMFSSLCMVSGLAQWRRGLWILGGILMGSIASLTLVAIMPTNKQLLDPSLDRGSDLVQQLLSRRSRLLAVRSGLSFVAHVVVLYLLTLA